MAILQGVCSSFKQQLFLGVHDFRASGGDVFKMALYTSVADLGADTTTYTTAGEVSSSGTNYPAGGITLTSFGAFVSGGVAYVDFADAVFANVNLTARGALIYNSTPSANGESGALTNPAVCVLDFGADRTAASNNFTVQFPLPTSTTAIVRID
jgi:hypothetical protein